ncbi:hypothetical protein H257_11958 [Aphanomyces astaci]|uniref:Uncharacterized protein n=1 Tax=Aphanomyces astaci TaxID=112090 RepID=W4G0B3_APHAT|nr:hypothetical protein, variant 1 [Aphanomyces astaci]XP_009837343.1 hypothetical protein H257_11958 [Aphanomyces astaci]ETV73137.1 hypothetical protein H257_11958 [Aphanomyces astaci]ETV73138.1 hypothetical protein, variant 1 [Aphanomyces astaci]|eukprot:XP_009837342.1 hypothetical protein, variant 1 [Aphanomyces astaci]
MNSQIRSNALGLALRSAVLRSHGGRAGRRMDLWQVRRGHHVLHPHFVVVASHRLVQVGVPKAWPAVGPFLTDRVGFGFPILSKLTHQGPVQAIAGVLADNVDASVSVTGLEVEVAAAIVFCTQVQNAPLLDDMTTVARFVHTKDNVTMVDEGAWVKAFGQDDNVAAFAVGLVEHTLLRVAASPSVMPTDLFDACNVPEVTSAHLAEMVNWLAVQQMLHHSFYDVYGN